MKNGGIRTHSVRFENLKCGNSVHYWEVLMFVHFQRVALRHSRKPMLRNVRAGSNLFGHDNTNQKTSKTRAVKANPFTARVFSASAK